MLERVKAIFEAEAAAIRNIPIDSSFEKAVALIHRQVHEKSGKLVTSGMGKAGQIAHNIATTFSSTGTPAPTCTRAKRSTAISASCSRTT